MQPLGLLFPTSPTSLASPIGLRISSTSRSPKIYLMKQIEKEMRRKKPR